MDTNIKQLEPQTLWNNFANLNAVPRASKKEEQVIEFMMSFGKRVGLETIKDHVGNVLIKKPATTGMENRKTVVLQSHLDMVHQKNNETAFDFATEGIKMYIDGDWVKADGTTLGADNGIGVAAIMSLLESSDIPHPALEALFTIDEETGMTGAKGLQGGLLQGEILLNLDTEEDDELDIGCAGGVDVSATKKYTEENVPANSLAFHITVKGLNGGHSGMDIHKGLGNANKIMNRLLWDGYENFGLRISKIEGGGLRNAIPRESNAWMVISTEKETTFLENIHLKTQEITLEYKSLEPNLQIVIEKFESPLKVMDVTTQEQLIKAIYAAHNGVFRMSPDIEDLVEASNNVARVEVGDGTIAVHNLTRSSVESSKMDVANQLKATFELMGATVEFSGSYPGWSPNVHSPILEKMTHLYEKMFAEKPKVMACHAGLECGILGTNYPTMDMISFGPTIQGAHSPDEKVCISSVQKFWKFLLETLNNIPSK